MKNFLLLMVLCLATTGCASTNPKAQKVVDDLYDGSKKVEQAVWDAM